MMGHMTVRHSLSWTVDTTSIGWTSYGYSNVVRVQWSDLRLYDNAINYIIPLPPVAYPRLY